MPDAHPDFSRLQAAISRDRLPDRVPVAEVEVDFEVMEAFIGRPISGLDALCDFWKAAGYDYALLQVRGQWLSDSFQIKVSEGLLHGDVHDTASTFAGAGVTDQAGFEAYPWIGPEGLYLRDVDLIEGIMPDGMKLVVTVGPIFSGVWRCMGLESFSFACVDNPELVHAVCEKMGEITVRIAEDVAQREYVGAIWLGDDLAYTQSLMTSPEFLRNEIFPFYRQIGDLCRQYGKLFIFHSDGLLTEVFDDLVGCGIQAVHPNEPTSVDIVEVKKQWGDRVALVGNIDVDLLSRGTPDEVAQATRRLIDTVAPGGGFALGSGNSVTKYVPLANYKAMLDTVRQCGSIYY